MLLFLSLIQTRNYAILINASQYWKNMRHSTDLHVIYNILVGNGFRDDDIVVYCCGDMCYDERKCVRGSVYFGEDFEDQENNSKRDDHHTENEKYFSQNKKSFDKNLLFCKKKLPESKFTPEMLYETISGNHEKLLQMDDNSDLLIYLTGHGNTNFLKLHNKHFILSTCLEQSLLNLNKRGINKVFVISDTCKAESLIDKEKLEENVVVLYTSGYEQDSYGTVYCEGDGMVCMDEFVGFLWRHVKFGLRKTVEEFFGEMRGAYEFGSDLIVSGEGGFLVSDFFVQRESDELCKFKV